MFFESGFFANFKYWVRYYDPELGESLITDDFNQKWTYFTKDAEGPFESLYDKNLKYVMQFGSSGDAKSYGSTGQISPIDNEIRRSYRGKVNLDPRVFYLDIETRTGTVYKGFPDPQKALEPVSLIQFLDSKTQIVHLIGDKDFYYKEWYLKQPDHYGYEVVYHKCSNEIEMFNTFFNFIRDFKPCIQYAWNGEGFDFPYLFNRAQRLNLDTSRFSPFSDSFPEKTRSEMAKLREDTFGHKYVAKLDCPGCFYIDIKEVYRKFLGKDKPSYSLNAIAESELGAKKLDHSEFRTFDDFYLGNYELPVNPTEEQKKTLCYKLTMEGASREEIVKAGHGQFLYYGVIDVVLLHKLDVTKRLTSLIAMIANRMNSQYDAVMGTTRIWTNYIRNVLLDRNVIITPEVMDIRGVDREKSINGGFVRDPEQGKHQFILSADVNSMYPLLSIAGSGMSPETFKFAWELNKDGNSEAEEKLKQFALNVLKVGILEEEQNENHLLKYDQKDEISKLLKEANLAMAPNGAFFDKSKDGIVPELVSEIYDERKQVKKAMFRKEQQIIIIDDILKHR